MPVDPNIALSVRAPAVRSPLESAERAIRISDMIATQNQRQIEERNRQEAEPLRRANLAFEQKRIAAETAKLEDDAALDTVFGETVQWDPEVGRVTFDKTKGVERLTQMGKANLIPSFDEQISTRQQKTEADLLAAMETELKRTEVEAGVISDFLALPEDQKSDAWLPFYRTMVQFDRENARIGQKYSPEAVKTLLTPAVERFNKTRTEATKLKTLQARKLEADTEKAEREARTETRSPGTLTITYDKDGKEISRESVPFKTEEISDKQRDTELVEEAYGQLKLKGKTRDKMTAAEKVAAKRWDEAASQNTDPSKLTDQQRLMALWRSGKPEDKALFNALKGNFDEGPSSSNKISILNTLINSATDTIGRFSKETFENNRKLYLPIWPDVPAYAEAQKLVDAAPPGYVERFLKSLPGVGEAEVLLPAKKPLRAVGMGDVRKEEAATGQGTPTVKPAATPSATTTRMRSPDGEEQDVPPGLVEHYKTLGATIVK